MDALSELFPFLREDARPPEGREEASPLAGGRAFTEGSKGRPCFVSKRVRPLESTRSLFLPPEVKLSEGRAFFKTSSLPE